MDKAQLLCKLSELKKNLVNLEDLNEELCEKKAKCKTLHEMPFTAVQGFDDANKESYIIEEIGEEPVKPLVHLLKLPTYIKLTKQYKKDIAEYNLAYEETEIKYFSDFKDKREEIKSEEIEERNRQISLIEASIDEISHKIEEVESIINSDTTLGDSLKSLPDASQIIEILTNDRADTLRDAVNLLYEDKHRKRIEELQEEQVRLTAEAVSAIQEAVDIANSAKSTAVHALERADEAYDLADSAYDMARDAYNSSKDDSD